MKILSFDLNTKCTGIFGVVLDNGFVDRVMSASIYVNDFDVREHFPYLKSKQKMPTNLRGNKILNTYCIKGETHVSETEKKKRDREVRNKRNEHQIRTMSQQFYDLINHICPDLVLIEKNEMFRGIMTIEILAKLTGTLIGQCAGLEIPYELYNVNTVRRPYNIPKLIKEFSKEKSHKEVASEEDLSKAAIKWYLTKKYAKHNIVFETMDESDAALVFDYWYEYIYKKG